MPSGNWRYIIALGCLIAGTALAYAQESEWVCTVNPAVKEDGQPEAECRPSDGNRRTISVQVVETPNQAEHSDKREAKSDQHEAADLAAQEKAADAADRAATAADGQVVPTWAQVIFAFLGTILLVWTLWLNNKAATDAAVAAKASQRAADAAEKAYLFDNRPWLKIAPTMIGSIDFKKREVEVQLKVENVGKTPAMNVQLLCHGYIVRITQIDKTHVSKLIDGYIKSAPYNTMLSALVFVGEPLETRTQGRIEELDTPNRNAGTEVGFALVCTATYPLQFGGCLLPHVDDGYGEVRRRIPANRQGLYRT